jgi:hypothetical protein
VARSTIVPVTPRVLNVATLCAYIGKSETWFTEHRAELEADGFPEPHPIIRGYDRVAVDAWLDRASPALLASSAPAARSWGKLAKAREA